MNEFVIRYLPETVESSPSSVRMPAVGHSFLWMKKRGNGACGLLIKWNFIVNQEGRWSLIVFNSLQALVGGSLPENSLSLGIKSQEGSHHYLPTLHRGFSDEEGKFYSWVKICLLQGVLSSASRRYMLNVVGMKQILNSNFWGFESGSTAVDRLSLTEVLQLYRNNWRETSL